MAPHPTKPRLLTGDRPTGRLHLGHYVGSLANRVKLQHQYESFFIIADLHTLTTRPEPQYIKEIPTYVRETVLDYLAVGIDPQISTIFVQSAETSTVSSTGVVVVGAAVVAGLSEVTSGELQRTAAGGCRGPCRSAPPTAKGRGSSPTGRSSRRPRARSRKPGRPPTG